MIWLFSTNNDSSTNNVIDYFLKESQSFVRVNSFSEFMENEFTPITLDDTPDVDSIWFRRDDMSYLNEIRSISKEIKDAYGIQVKGILESEYKMAIKGFHSLLMSKTENVLGHSIKNYVNKIDVLIEAKKVGFKIPFSMMTTKKKDIISNFKRNLVTKGIDNVFRVTKERLNGYTEKISEEQINKISNTFFISLFQEEVKKEYEIRTFYLDGKCYSMAIFSQNDDQTQVDFRRYNPKKGNRRIPFQHSEEEIDMIRELMAQLGLNTGSFDFIMNTEGEMVFLEVNPVGQYGMVSAPCNYNLDGKISKFLMYGKQE